MGIFKKLFSANKNLSGVEENSNDLLDNILENQRNIKTSANYQIACAHLKTAFYAASVSPESFYNNVDLVRKILTITLDICSKELTIPSNYYNLPITFVENRDRSIYGYIIEFNDAKYECECNFVGMVMIDGEKTYYTSEYYKMENTFYRCRFTDSGIHAFSSISTCTYDDFKCAILDKG